MYVIEVSHSSIHNIGSLCGSSLAKEKETEKCCQYSWKIQYGIQKI